MKELQGDFLNQNCKIPAWEINLDSKPMESEQK